MAAFPAPVRVLWSAFRAGSLASVLLRPSSRSGSGAVLVCSFRSLACAGAFARRWALRLGVSVAVRSGAGLFAVSVPVGASVSAPVALPVAGGVCGVVAVAAALAAATVPSVPPVPPAPSGGSFGFCGSRSLPASFAPVVAGVVGSLPVGAAVSVGCSSGADSLVRAAAPGAHVWSVASGGFGGGARSFARRSAALVRSLPVGAAWFVGFVSSACPAGVAPARSWRSGASVSGSWSSLALAAGVGLRVAVVWCGAGALTLPAWPGGSWVSVSVAPWSDVALPCSLWVWSPVARPSLFAAAPAFC